MPTDILQSDLSGYFNRMAPGQPGSSVNAARWEVLRFRSRRPLQSSELNELQTVLLLKLQAAMDALLKPGAVMSGAVPQIIGGPSSVPNFKVSEGSVYFVGTVRDTAEQTLTLPFTEKVQVGIRFRQTDMTELTDPTLLDPAPGSANYQEAGAARLVGEWVWGWRGDSTDDGFDDNLWDFIPVYEVDHGVIVVKDSVGVSDPVLDLLARYDFEANGDYVASGLGVEFVTSSGGNYIFKVAAGTADIRGYKVDVLTDKRLTYAINPDVQTVTGEIHAASPDVDGKYQMSLNREPLSDITFLSCIKRDDVPVVKTAGGSDEIDGLGSVYGVVQVYKQAGAVHEGYNSGTDTLYALGTDYTVSGDNIVWVSGHGPATGNTYRVTYNYTKIVIDTANSIVNDGTLEVVQPTFIVVKGAINGTPVSINYTYKLPRVDLITLNPDGTIVRTVGVAARRNPAAPKPSRNQVALAEIYQDWVNPPEVTNVSIRATKMSDLVDMRREMNAMEANIANLFLLSNTALKDPSSKHGVFVDGFVDDSQRDQGLAQTAAVVGNHLQPPIAVSVVSPSDLSARSQFWMLPYTQEIVIQQAFATGQMKINPYQSFEPVPAKLVLNPGVDRWTEVVATFASPVTEIFNTRGKYRGPHTRDVVLGETTADGQFLRSRTVQFTITDFLPNESLAELLFDGLNVTPAGPLVANASGTINGSFTIPANVPAGVKSVTARGNGSPNSRATAAYVGEHVISTQTLQKVTVIVNGRIDPLAQTFTLPEARIIASIDLKFLARGNTANNVYVQIRETSNGVPTSSVLAEGVILGTSIVTNGSWTTATFGIPVPLLADVEYAIVVLTDDATHAVAIGELGKKWTDGGVTGIFTAQPYSVGELLSSSNAKTWTPHPTMDLAFRMNACLFTSTTRTVDFGQVAFVDTTDFLVRASVLRPDPNADCDFRMTELFTIPGNSSPQIHNIQEDVPVQLVTKENGNVKVEALLSGTSKMSPILFPEPQVILGVIADTGTYYSAATQADPDFKVVVRMEVYRPGSASVTPTVQRQLMSGGLPVVSGGVYSSEYVALVRTGIIRLEDGWQEETWKSHPDVADNVVGWTPPVLRGVGLDYFSRTKLVLSGSARDRIMVRSLSVVHKD